MNYHNELLSADSFLSSKDFQQSMGAIDCIERQLAPHSLVAVRSFILGQCSRLLQLKTRSIDLFPEPLISVHKRANAHLGKKVHQS